MSLIPSFGSLFWTVAAFVVALSIIVAIHEYGHYIVGRWSGIQAETFSIGFGPVLWSRTDRRGTRWQVAALPLGGYVKFLGDANAASAGADLETMASLSPEERRHTMHGAPLWARAATVAAGPVFNFLFSVAVFTGLFLYSGIATDQPVIGKLLPLPGGTGELREGDTILAVEGLPTPDWEAVMEAVGQVPDAPLLSYRVLRDGEELTLPGPTLYPPRAASILPGSAAIDAGIEKGDVILAIDGTPISRFEDLQSFVRRVEGRPMVLTLWRDGQTFDVTLAPRQSDQPKPEGGFETRYLIGLTGELFFEPLTRDAGLGEAVQSAAGQTWFVARSSLSGMWHIVTGAISACNLRGPIGIAETSGATASQGLADFIWFIAVLSTAVGLLNLFPIPMLDGGHLVFHAVEWATGKPLSDRALNIAMSIGLALVLSLMAFGLTNDLICP
jgi:regulator of sigma E protease